MWSFLLQCLFVVVVVVVVHVFFKRFIIYYRAKKLCPLGFIKTNKLTLPALHYIISPKHTLKHHSAINTCSIAFI